MRTYILLIITLLLFTSCSTTRGSRGSLSSAVKKSKKKDRSERTIREQSKDDEEEEDFTLFSFDFSDDEEESEKAKRNNTKIHFVEKKGKNYANRSRAETYNQINSIESELKSGIGIFGGGGVVSSDAHSGSTMFGVKFLSKDRVKNEEFGLNAKFLYANIKEIDDIPYEENENSDQVRAGIKSLGLGLEYNKYLTSPHTFMGVYLSFGLGLEYMWWKYDNPIIVVDDEGYEDEINWDGIFGFNTHVGLGVNLVQTEQFNFGAVFKPGFILWSWETNQGFTNDVFDSFLYAKLEFVMTFY